MAEWTGEILAPPKPIDSDLHRMGYENPFGYEDGYQEGYTHGRRHGYAKARDEEWMGHVGSFLIGMGLGGLLSAAMVLT
jgi:hypothetical protein